tara:strand:+ start:852 stop:1061 length:210 start_codon:yes stop_codon:yes gene_type:complete
MKAKIKLWDEDRLPVAELTIPRDASYMLETDAFVARCWKAADSMALILTPSDTWGVEMVITCDFTEEKK